MLRRSPKKIGAKDLQKYEEFVNWLRGGQIGPGPTPPPPPPCTETPDETLARVVGELRGLLETDLLERVLRSSPQFFEQIVVDLLIAMGYGGGDAAHGSVTGRSGDGGVDGVVREDKLGLGRIYFQAKRYAADNSVGAGALRNFVGAIVAANTNKGVFVTTSSFTREAWRYADRNPTHIVMIDGKRLANLMVEYGVGVRTKSRFVTKRVDEDYFEA